MSDVLLDVELRRADSTSVTRFLGRVSSNGTAWLSDTSQTADEVDAEALSALVADWVDLGPRLFGPSGDSVVVTETSVSSLMVEEGDLRSAVAARVLNAAGGHGLEPTRRWRAWVLAVQSADSRRMISVFDTPEQILWLEEEDSAVVLTPIGPGMVWAAINAALYRV